MKKMCITLLLLSFWVCLPSAPSRKHTITTVDDEPEAKRHQTARPRRESATQNTRELQSPNANERNFVRKNLVLGNSELRAFIEKGIAQNASNAAIAAQWNKLHPEYTIGQKTVSRYRIKYNALRAASSSHAVSPSGTPLSKPDHVYDPSDASWAPQPSNPLIISEYSDLDIVADRLIPQPAVADLRSKSNEGTSNTKYYPHCAACQKEKAARARQEAKISHTQADTGQDASWKNFLNVQDEEL